MFRRNNKVYIIEIAEDRALCRDVEHFLVENGINAKVINTPIIVHEVA